MMAKFSSIVLFIFKRGQLSLNDLIFLIIVLLFMRALLRQPRLAEKEQILGTKTA